MELAVSASNPVSIFVCMLVAGCVASVQGGLANAPTLADATPETRVHDAIANGRDSCERAAFPPGEVLRGHTPPCVEKERRAMAPALPPSVSQDKTWVSPFYPPSICQAAGPGLVEAKGGLAAASLAPAGEIACGHPLVGLWPRRGGS